MDNLMLQTEKIASCIVSLHCPSKCGAIANSGFYCNDTLSVHDKVARSAKAQELLSKCGNSLDIEEEAIKELFIIRLFTLLSIRTR